MDRLTQIQNYFDGKMTKREAEDFLQWFLSENDNEEVQAEFDKLWHANTRSEFDWNGQELYHKILKSKNNERSLNVALDQPEKITSSRNNWWKVAAAVSLLIVASVFLINRFDIIESTQEVYAEVIKNNPAGQKSKVYLPDGTIVNLNSESSITFAEDFASGRTVYLEGEAFFDVTEDPSRPFTVHSGGLSTTALGTSFNIKTYEADLTEVTLVTGKVKVEKEGSEERVFLIPGERAALRANSESIQKDKADLQAITYWKEGVLYFDQTNINEVISTLERWYGVEITASKLPDLKCSGTFQKNEYLTNVLDILSYSVGFEYSLDGKEVKLEFNQK